MVEKNFGKKERRRFLRVDFTTPLAYKICKKSTINKLLEGYTSNISQAGLLCNLKTKVKKGEILWLSFDRSTLNICEELEKRSLVYQNGIIGKVVWLKKRKDGTFDVGIQFLTREEKNLTNIHPKIYFLQKQGRLDSLLNEEEEWDEEEYIPDDSQDENSTDKDPTDFLEREI